jgi:transposase-like protein
VRLLSTKAGDVELKIPKLREGSFFPALLEPRRRIDRALLAVVMEGAVASAVSRPEQPHWCHENSPGPPRSHPTVWLRRVLLPS